MAYADHQRSGQGISARCAIITLSDTRTTANDASGARIRQLLEESGHEVVSYQIIPDDPAVFSPTLEKAIAEADVILTNGGTGISRRDQTIDAVVRLLELPLPGFGELFRMLSWEQIGSGAMLSRAVGGITRGKLVFSMPGSTAAVELAMTRLILPELGHLLSELRK